MSERIQITTLRDMIDAGNTEARLDELLADVKHYIQTVQAVEQFHEGLIPNAPKMDVTKGFTWIPDGKGRIDATVDYGEGLTLQIKTEEE